MHPIRTRFVATAMAACIAQPSKIGSFGLSPRLAMWSITQTWSKPASSAVRHTFR